MEQEPHIDGLVGNIFADKYELIELLGDGGMSSVYKANHMVMDKVVALKILHNHLSQHGLALRRFQNEAQAAGTIDHPGVVSIYDCGEYNGRPYLVMDYVQGEPLSQILARGPLSLDRFLSIMLQVCQAVAHAHKKGIVHRDLKPSNIMITQVGEKDVVKIVDFGIAKVLSTTGNMAHQLTATGEFCGTPFYMSPEQCAGAHVDARSDIYSLGCVMFEALTGSVPFDSISVFETFNKHMNAPPPPLVAPQIEADSRQKLEVLVLRAIAKQPGDRFHNMDELEHELRTISLKSKGGIFSYIGGAWELASAKRRAERKNRIPLIGVTLFVSCLSMVCMSFLLFALHDGKTGVARLEQSRITQDEICILLESLAHVTTAARPYQKSIFLNANLVEENKKIYDDTVGESEQQLKKVGTALQDNTKLHKEFNETWSPGIADSIKHFGDSVYGMYKKNGGAVPVTFNNMVDLFTVMTNDVQKCNKVLTAMIQEVDAVERRQLEQVYNTERWIDYVAILCLSLNGLVMLSLFVYLAKGTPQRLKQLSQSAAKISKSRGLAQAPTGQDVVEDLDMALQVLATALTEAEEREKILSERERSLQKQLAEKYPDQEPASGNGRKSTKGTNAAADFRNIIRANVDLHPAGEIPGKPENENT